MATTVPTLDGPQVQNRPLGAPQVQQVRPDSSGLELFNTAANVAGGLAQQEIARADNAAIMDAEAKLSQTKLDLMFNPDSGVYGKKGKDALDITNNTLPTFDLQAELIGRGLTNQRQKDQYAQIVNHQRGGLNQELNRYEFTQRNQYYDDVDQANIATSLDGAVKYANDPSQVAYYQSKGNFTIGQMGIRKGMPAEAIQLEQQKFNSDLSVNVISRMSTKDPLQAQQYYAGNFQNMTAEGQAKAEQILNVSVYNQMGANMAANAMKGTGTVGVAGLPSLIMQQESGGNQNAVSPKGAIGAMQMMPDTAKETAKEMGVPYDPERLANDKNYNMALGTAYLNKMTGYYTGNTTLAVAAYNAGPGAVDKWLKQYGDPRKGEITDAQFIASIPYKETREYTESITNKLHAPQVDAAVTGKDRYAQALAVGATITNPALKKSYLDSVDDYHKAQTAQENANFDDAAKYVVNGGLKSVPPALMTNLPADDQLKLQRMDDYQRKGQEPKTDYGLMERQLSMTTDQLGALSLERDIRPYYSNSDFNVMRTAWEKAKAGDSSPKDIAAAKEKVIATGMESVGISTGNSKDAKATKNIEKQELYRNSVQDRIDSFTVKNGREPNVEETEDLVNQLRLKVKLTGGGTLWGDSTQTLWEVKPEDLQDTYVDKSTVKFNTIPPSERRRIINLLRAKNQQASEANVSALYIQEISGLGVKVK